MALEKSAEIMIKKSGGTLVNPCYQIELPIYIKDYWPFKAPLGLIERIASAMNSEESLRDPRKYSLQVEEGCELEDWGIDILKNIVELRNKAIENKLPR